MSTRRALTSLIRIASAAPVGLHSGEITHFTQLLGSNHSLAAPCTSFPSSLLNSQCENASKLHAHAPQRRHFHNSVAVHAAAAAADTTQSIPEQYDLLPPTTGTIRIDGYDATGFIVGDVQVEGSILCFGDIWLAWSARTLSDLSLESLTFVDLVKPPPELIVLGCGHAIEQVPQELLLQLKERDIAVEAMDTVNAVATFNILNQEGRKVVGAMLPASVGMATSVEE